MPMAIYRKLWQKRTILYLTGPQVPGQRADRNQRAGDLVNRLQGRTIKNNYKQYPGELLTMPGRRRALVKLDHRPFQNDQSRFVGL